MESIPPKKYQFQLSIQNQVLGKLNEGCSLKEIIDVLTLAVESQFTESKCSVLLLDQSSKTLRNCSAPNLPKLYLEKIEGVPISLCIGPCAAAAYNKEIVVIEDIASNSTWKDWKNLALINNLHSCWSFPIFSSKKNVLGTFAVYHSKSSKPQAEEIKFINSFAEIAGSSIETKNTQKELRDSEECYKAIIDQSVDALMIHDLQGNIFKVNSQACKSLCYSEEELLNLTIQEIETQFDLLTMQQKWEEAVLGKFIQMEGEHRRKDGTLFPVETSIGIVNINKNNYIQTSTRDITKRKRSEEDLENYKNNLESLVQEKNKDLEEAKQKIEKANQAKNEFLSKMSHELRTPLNAVLGFAEIIKSNHKKPLNKTEENIEHVIDGGEQLLETINRLLDLSQLEKEAIKFRNETFLVNSPINNLISSLKSLAEKSGVTIENQIPESSNHTIYADSARFDQVMLNLISNAIKYNRENGFVVIGARAIDDSNLEIFIKDSGKGIPKDQQAQIFDPFNRLTRYSASEGMGIGLSITKLLVEAMNGSLSLESEENQGSTFFVRFLRRERPS